jgi:protein required for attachment to host cells
MNEPRIWVLVADGQTARLYRSSGDMNRLIPALAHEVSVGDAAHVAPVVSHAPVFEEADIWNDPEELPQMPAGFSTMGLHDSRMFFADHLARLLRDGASDDAYDALIIAAAPHLMPSLDRALAPETRARLMGCVVDDLMHLGPAGLSAYLRHHVVH